MVVMANLSGQRQDHAKHGSQYILEGAFLAAPLQLRGLVLHGVHGHMPGYIYSSITFPSQGGGQRSAGGCGQREDRQVDPDPVLTQPAAQQHGGEPKCGRCLVQHDGQEDDGAQSEFCDADEAPSAMPSAAAWMTSPRVTAKGLGTCGDGGVGEAMLPRRLSMAMW